MGLVHAPLRARHPKPAKASPADPAATTNVDDEAGAEKTVLCVACGAAITSLEHRIAVSGSHEHRFMNPAGFTFHLGCFSSAIGCTVVGPDSLEYPWFPGFSWRYAMCGACGCHLGWHFRKPDRDGFFGLILDRVQQGMPDA
jgi:hypothetical protein